MRQAFASSEFIRQMWPPGLVEQTLPFFRYQRAINRVLWEGGNPLRQIEDLHAVLSETSLQTLPLWLLGSDDVRQRIAEAATDDTMQLRFMQGVRALAVRDYLVAAAHFQRSDRPLLVYALCLAGQRDAAIRLARRVNPSDEAEDFFWAWLKKTFDVGPVDAK